MGSFLKEQESEGRNTISTRCWQTGKGIKPPLSSEAQRADLSSLGGEDPQGSSGFPGLGRGDGGSEQDCSPSREGKCGMKSTQQAEGMGAHVTGPRPPWAGSTGERAERSAEEGASGPADLPPHSQRPCPRWLSGRCQLSHGLPLGGLQCNSLPWWKDLQGGLRSARVQSQRGHELPVPGQVISLLQVAGPSS